MTEKTADLRATLKAGTGYDSPWLTVDASTPEELEFKLQALANGTALASLVEAANALKAANNAAPLAPQGQEAAQQAATPVQQQPAGWGQSTEPVPSWAAQSAQPQQQAAPVQQQQSKFGGPPHPEGKQCEAPGCGKVLEHKKTSSGKATWRCPDWRWQNGNPNGHTSEFIN